MSDTPTLKHPDNRLFAALMTLAKPSDEKRRADQIAAEVIADHPPRPRLVSSRNDYDREGIDGWNPEYDSGA